MSPAMKLSTLKSEMYATLHDEDQLVRNRCFPRLSATALDYKYQKTFSIKMIIM